MNPIVILGSGLAGYTLAREIRKLDKRTPLTVISGDDGGFYSKPMLSNALAGGKSPAALVSQTAEQMALQLGAEILCHTRVTAIDRARRRLETGSGTVAYDKLVLAVGAEPIRLPLGGNGASEVLAVNNLADYTVFRDRLAGKRRVAVLGAGLIGCEFANDLVSAGYEVALFDVAPLPLGRLLPPEAARRLRDRLAAAGIRWHLGTSISRVNRHGSGYLLATAQGRAFEADLVLSAVGLRPQAALARDGGITVNRGIVVDRHLATSDPAVYALGDCAEVGGLVLPYVLPIMQAARALGATLAGAPQPLAYPAMPVVVKTPACPTVVCPPPAGIAGSWREAVSAEGVRSVFVGADGREVGFALIGSATAERQKLAALMPPVLATEPAPAL